MKILTKSLLASAVLLCFGTQMALAADAPIRQLGSVTVDGEDIEFSDIVGGFHIGDDDSNSVTISNEGFTEYNGDKGELLKTANRGVWVTTDDKSTINGRNITISSKDGRAIQADSGASLSIGGDTTESITVNSNSMGIFVLTGAQMNIKTHDLTINETSENGFGIHVQNNTQTSTAPEGASYLKIDAENIVVNSTALGLSAFSNGRMDISGNIVVNAVNAIDARGNSTVNINTDGLHTTVLNGDIVFETPYTKEDSHGSGNLINAYINVGLHGDGSSWTGRAYQTFKGENNSAVETVDLDNGNATFGNVTGFTLSISDGGTWNMTGDSFVNDVDASEQANIVMQKDAAILNVDQMSLDNSTISMQGDSNQQININELSVDNATVNMNATTDDGKKVSTGHLTARSVAEGGSVNINYTGITSDDIVDAEAAFDSAQSNVALDGVAQKQTFSEGDVMGELTREVSASGEAGLNEGRQRGCLGRLA